MLKRKILERAYRISPQSKNKIRAFPHFAREISNLCVFQNPYHEPVTEGVFVLILRQNSFRRISWIMVNAVRFYRNIFFSYLSSSSFSLREDNIYFSLCCELQRFQRVKLNEWYTINIKVRLLIWEKKWLQTKRRVRVGVGYESHTSDLIFMCLSVYIL